MSLDNVKQFQQTAFFIPRYTDKQLIERFDELVQEGGYKLEKFSIYFLYASQPAEFSGDLKDAKLQELLGIETISTATAPRISPPFVTSNQPAQRHSAQKPSTLAALSGACNRPRHSRHQRGQNQVRRLRLQRRRRAIA